MSLAGLAGWVDAIAFVRWNGLFVSFMSGNSTTLAASLSDGAWQRAVPVAVVILSFIAGVVCGEVIARGARRWGGALLLLAEAALFCAAAGASTIDGATWLPAIPLAVALGAQNASIHEVGGVSIATTYVTGTVVHIGRGILDAVAGGGPWRAPMIFIALWCALLCGAAMGGLVARQSATTAIATAALAALMFAGMTAWRIQAAGREMS
jgi:uncharacterized membrane protein YoaK (UPF0700 family)